VGVYVDDLIVIGGSAEVINEFKRQMLTHQKNGVITLSQCAYAAKIVEKAGLSGCNSSATPMEPRLKLRRESKAPLVDGTAYRSLVGSLRYLVNTRPDLAYSAGYVSRFMERLTEEHLAVVKRIIRYVAGTMHLGCQYKKNNQVL
jgi:hypothetical protein